MVLPSILTTRSRRGQSRCTVRSGTVGSDLFIVSVLLCTEHNPMRSYNNIMYNSSRVLHYIIIRAPSVLKSHYLFGGKIDFCSPKSQISISEVVRYLVLTGSTRAFVWGIARPLKLKSGTWVSKSRVYSKHILAFNSEWSSY